MKERVIKCVVACHNASGEPDFFFCRIGCMQEQYDDGEHYEAARCPAQRHGYEGDFVVYDENDGPNGLFQHFVWESADTGEVDDLVCTECSDGVWPATPNLALSRKTARCS